jgi:hypothetical protein
MVGIGGLNVSLSDMAVRASRAGGSSTGQGLLVMLRTADFIFDAAIALAETLETAVDHIDDVQVRAEVENTVQRVAAAVAALETAITQGHDHVELRTLDQALAAVGDKLMAWQQIAMVPAEDDPESLALHRIAWALQTVARHVHAAADILARYRLDALEARPGTAGERERRRRGATIVE